jgi:hypothetical protein
VVEILTFVRDSVNMESKRHATHAADRRTSQPQFPRRENRLDPHRREGMAGASDAHETHGHDIDGARSFRFALGGFAEREHRPLI